MSADATASGIGPAERVEHLRRDSACVSSWPLPAAGRAQTLDEVVTASRPPTGRSRTCGRVHPDRATTRASARTSRPRAPCSSRRAARCGGTTSSPSPQQIVSDGTSLWVYTPELNQVNKGEAPKALAGPAGSFLAGLGKMREEFTVRFLEPGEPARRPGPAGARPHAEAADPAPHAAGPHRGPEGLRGAPGRHLRPAPEHRHHDVHEGRDQLRARRHLFVFTPPKGAAVVPLEPR